MNSSTSAGAARCSTDELPIRDRLPIWCDVFGRVILKLEFQPVDGRPFRERASMLAFDNLGVMFGETNGIRAQRNRALLAGGNDDLYFQINLSGFSLPSQLGRNLKLDAGEAVLLTSAETGSQYFPDAARLVSLRIPRRTLAGLVADPEGAVMRRVPAKTEALRLLVDYVGMTVGRHELATSELQRLFVAHVHDLVALAVGATADATEVGLTRGLPAARLGAIKADVARLIVEETLSVVEVAKRHRVTPRYVQMLFEGEGRTFTEYVIEQRLTRAHRMLSDQRFADRSISAIAFEVGFANLSYFNRVFRRRYGGSPSDVRGAARRSDT